MERRVRLLARRRLFAPSITIGVLPKEASRGFGFCDDADQSGVQLADVPTAKSFVDRGIRSVMDRVEMRCEVAMTQPVRSRQNQPLD